MATLRDQTLLLPLLARAGLAACVIDRRGGQILESCETLAQLLGQSPEALRGADVAQVLGLQLHALCEAADGAPLRTGPPLHAEVHSHLADPDRVVILVRPLRRERELEQQAEASRTAQRFLDSLLEHIPDMIFVKDARELRFVRFNQAGEELLGYPREALLGKNDYDFFPRAQADFFTAKDRAVLAGGALLDIPEEKIQTRAKGERLLHTKKIPLLGADGQPQYLLGISEDITERKRAEAERDRSRDDLTRLQLERDLRERFVSMLSHDLRNPLTAARAAAELLRRAPVRDERRDRLADRIVDSLKRADRMLEDLLDASRLRAGEPVALEQEPCDLVKVAREALDELSVLHGERITLRTPMSALVGYWSAEKLLRVIENLVSNAVKYGAPDGRVTIALEADGADARVRVHNDGPPIPSQEQALLFEPFTRSRAASRSGEKGWGLGLAVVKGIALAHGGTVGVESRAGAGTTFTVELPLRPAPALRAPDIH